AVVPLSHTYGFDNVVLPLLMQGNPALLIPSPLPALILRALACRAPMVLSAVPFLIDLIARHPSPHGMRSGLRTCLSAGAPLKPASAEAFAVRFGVPVWIQYGTSEAGAIAFDTDVDAGAIEGRVGVPVKGAVVDVDRSGRIVVSGPAVASACVPDG